MRLLVVVAAVFSFTAGAVDYRDCRELYVSPLTAQVPDRKASGAPWDYGSVVDARISPMVSDPPDGVSVVGPAKTNVACSALWRNTAPSTPIIRTSARVGGRR